MRTRTYRTFACDFETTVYEGQENTEVWASAVSELYTEDVQLFGSIEDTFEYFKSMNSHVIGYYHNLKFDGSFWLDFLLRKLKFKQAYYHFGKLDTQIKWKREKDMCNKEFKYSISDHGQWYSIIIKVNNKFIEFRDSAKLLPFSLKRIGESFKTKHRKLEMEYKGYRYAGCEIKAEEREYIQNDVLVLKEALEIMFDEGHNKLTIGSCCLSEYKNICRTSLKNQLTYKEMFPNLYDIKIAGHYFTDNDLIDKSSGTYVRRSYKGGWCYLVKGKENRVYRNGTTADVNSLYPSVMHSESGNYYPVGYPHFFTGEIPKEALLPERYYFVRIKTRFYLKEGKLPFIQIKNNLLYDGTEMLESSDVKFEGKYWTHYRDKGGVLKDTRVELTLTMTDYQLLCEHYNLVDFELLDGCWFYAQIGIFDEYIDKYREIKVSSTGAKRELAKLFLNNLYGKLASSTDSSFKLAYLNENGEIKFKAIPADDKQPGYIACGTAVTSYARNFTIRAAQKNYHGKDKPGFIYADTDSIHCDISPEEIKGVKTDDTAFCCWKLESCWDKAIFVRQKTYIEHVVMENLNPCEPHHVIKCAGMPEACKELFIESMSETEEVKQTEDGKILTSLGKVRDPYNLSEREFLFGKDGKKIHRGYQDFKIGIEIPGKLRPKRINGGILLVDSAYKMRRK